MFDEDNEPVTSPDTENETQFSPSDAPNGTRLDGSETHYEHYSRLFKYNSGNYNQKWGDQEQLRRQDNLALFDAIAGQVELTDTQHTEGRELLDNLNVREIGYGAELVAFCTCIHVAEQDGRTHIYTGDALNDDPFVHFAARQNYHASRIFACLSSVREVVSRE